MAKILIIDDEPAIRSTLADILERRGAQDRARASRGRRAIAQFARDEFDLMLLDLWLPGIDGLAVLERLRNAGAPPVIMISGHGSVDAAVKRHAARRVRLSREAALARARAAHRQPRPQPTARLREQVRDLQRHLTLEEMLIGESEPMQRSSNSRSAAPRRRPRRVLITGENGSGKEIVARTLHRHSLRADQPFIDVNCAAIPEELIESELFGHRKGAFTGAIDDRKGKFELADGGTLFLDEIGDMSLKTQAKVLRVLQEQTFQRVGGQQTVKVDVRVLAATNKDLEAEIAGGIVPQRLYYRLNVIPIEVPPLRARGNDIVLLAEHFLRRFAAEDGAAEEEALRRRRRQAARPITGPATCASCATSSSGWPSSCPARPSKPRTSSSATPRRNGPRDRRQPVSQGSARRVRKAVHPGPPPRVRRQRQPHRRIPRRRAQQPLSQDRRIRHPGTGMTSHPDRVSGHA